MTRMLERLGVDALQWRVLLKASLRIDFPVAASKKTRAERRTLNLIGVILMLYALAGITPAIIAYRSSDVLLGAASLTTIVAFMVASTLLLGEGTNIVSPSDHQILGFRPVTSRTYLAVRIAALLIRSVVVAGVVSVLPVAVYLLKGGLHPGLALAAFVSAQLCGVAVTLAIVAMYGWVLRVAGPARTMRYTGYMQLIASTATWGGFMLVTQGITERALAGMSLSGTAWWIALPTAWFASYAMIAAGGIGWLSILAALLSLASIAALGWMIRDKLSMAYTEQLSRLAAVTVHAAPRASTWLGALNDETRAVAILVRSQLEHDMKFRLALISMVPITVIYMIAGGWPIDPFLGGRRSGGNPGLIQMALLFIPMTLRQAIVSSENYRASWIFHATPADRGKLVLSARNVITGFFLLPYLACLAALFAWAFVDSTHALLHALFLGLLSWMILQFTIMLSPQLPFSMPHGKDTEAGAMFIRMMLTMAVGLASYFLLISFIYKSTARMAVAAVAFVAIGLAMDWLTRIRVRKRPIEKMYVE